MTKGPGRGAVILIGLLVVSFALYWAADTGSALLQGSLLALLGVIALAAIRPSK